MRRALPGALTALVLLAGPACARTDGAASPAAPTTGPVASAPTSSAPTSAAPTSSGPRSSAATTTGPTTSGGGRPVTANATVDRVVDGDTLVVRVGGQRERLRLVGINTPESVDPDRPVMCFGKEAAAHLEQLVPPGTPVRIERDVEPRDKFGRLLGYLYRAADGLFVNLAQVADGFANQYTFPPNVAHEQEFRAAARTARATGTGLWGACPAPFER